jgi:hypothetical protein
MLFSSLGTSSVYTKEANSRKSLGVNTFLTAASAGTHMFSSVPLQDGGLIRTVADANDRIMIAALELPNSLPAGWGIIATQVHRLKKARPV